MHAHEEHEPVRASLNRAPHEPNDRRCSKAHLTRCAAMIHARAAQRQVLGAFEGDDAPAEDRAQLLPLRCASKHETNLGERQSALRGS